MTVYIRVRAIAEQQHLTVRELAQLAGLSPATVRKFWQDPRHKTNTKILDKLSKALQVDASELIRSEHSRGHARPPDVQVIN